MSQKKISNPASGMPTLTDDELNSFREIIYDECGISLKESKRSMMSARLFKRLRVLGMRSFNDYLDYLTVADNRVREITSMIDVMTTNKTDFFREKNHFDLLTQQLLPKMIAHTRFQKEQKLYLWSAGCSSGEEPYTLAMVLDDFFKTRESRYDILATDISTKVLRKARQAVYPDELITPVPAPMRRKYLMPGKGKFAGHSRVVPELRKRVIFGRLNFMDNNFGIDKPMDVIFCRNVIIYFDWQTKVKLIHKFFEQLRPGGYLFIGHSETLNGINEKFIKVAPTVFQKV